MHVSFSVSLWSFSVSLWSFSVFIATANIFIAIEMSFPLVMQIPRHHCQVATVENNLSLPNFDCDNHIKMGTASM